MSNKEKDEFINLIKEFYQYAKEQLQFNFPCKTILKKDENNAKNTLGKTAEYNPETKEITLYITNRHPKDILRSYSHELQHHKQNCDGKFNQQFTTEEGYAQNNKHLRELEKEAYLYGNMLFRDWEDNKKRNNPIQLDIYEKRNIKMKTKLTPQDIIKPKDWKEKLFENRNTILMNALFGKQGLVMQENLSEGEEDLPPLGKTSFDKSKERHEKKLRKQNKNKFMAKLSEKQISLVKEAIKKFLSENKNAKLDENKIATAILEYFKQK